MKIGVMSDTHLERPSDALQKIMDVHFRDADLVLHAGDIVAGPVLAYLEACGVTAVCGNMDRAEIRSALPAKRVIEAGGFRIGLIHGYGDRNGLAERLRAEFDDIDCLVYGHSHAADNRLVGPELYFNPGTALMSAFGGNTVGMLHISDGIRGEIIPVD